MTIDEEHNVSNIMQYTKKIPRCRLWLDHKIAELPRLSTGDLRRTLPTAYSLA